MIVTKRDGTRVSFETKKIINAVSKANAQTQEMTNEDITRIVQSVEAKCQKLGEKFSVESIQDIIEDTLLKSRFNKTAKAFILYRDKRTRIRESKSRLIKEVGQRLKGHGIVNQNANVDEASFSGRKGEATNTLTKWYALEYCMSEKSKENHLNNEIYVHDLDHYSIGAHNCLSIPFDQLLARGFTSRQTDIRPASSINTAFQLLAVIFQLQSLQQFGGVSATHLDWTMVPYVRKSFAKHYKHGLTYIDGRTEIDYEIEHMLAAAVDYSITDSEYEAYSSKAYQYARDMTQKELDQAVEGMIHNMNTLQSRSGGQVPFSSINYGTCTLEEGRMVIKALLEGTIIGVGKYHRTAIFPCCIFQYMKGVNDKPGTPNYDLYRLALKATAKRFYPNYALCSWSVNTAGDEYDVKVRQACVDQLSNSETRKLIERLKLDPNAQTLLGLKLIDNQIVAERINDPRCYFSTMGK